MLFSSASVSLLLTASLASLVYAHGVVTEINGANGITTPGFANVAGTDRTSGRGRAPRADTSVIRDETCGKTKAGGQVDIATELSAIETSTGVPSATANGQVNAVIHQVNADGAGPYTFEVSPTAQGGDWIAMTVQTNVPGDERSRSNNLATDFPVSATIPAGTRATCLIRAKNSARAGPFGSCFAVTQKQGAAAATRRQMTRRIGAHTNWLVRKIGGLTVSWEGYRRG